MRANSHPDWAAIVLAGGAGRRMGGPDKPVLPVAGIPMLHRVLAAAAGAGARVVVGPAGLPVPAGVLLDLEQPPGGGPVAALAAGLAALTAGHGASDPVPRQPPPTWSLVAVLAADLPLLSPAALARLRESLLASPAAGACYVDGTGRRQILCALWRTTALRDRLAGLAAGRGTLVGAALRELYRDAEIIEVASGEAGAPPWYDCDTPQELRRAEGWLA